MPTKKKKFNARFPPARIKKIMQTDEEVGKVAAAVPVIISKALEMFMQNLMLKASEYTQARNAKTMTTSHLKSCITSEKQFDFLKDLVESVPDLPANEEDGDGETKPKRRRAQPSEGRKRKPNKHKVKQPQSSDSEDEEQESEEEESGSSENQAAAGASVANNVAIPKITFTGPDNNQVTKTNDPPAMSINVPISSHAPFGTSVDEEDDDYDS